MVPTAIVMPGTRASTPTRTSARASAWPTTSSATARRRSRPTSARYLHPASNAGRFVDANPAGACRRSPAVRGPMRTATTAGLRPPERGASGPARRAATCAAWAIRTTAEPRRRPRSIRRSSGLGRAPYDWQFGVSVQQEVMPRVSAEVGYYRRWWPIYDGADITDNILVASASTGSSASWRRPIRVCRTVAATPSAASTTSPRRRARRTENVRKAANCFGDTRATGTASTSRPRRGCERPDHQGGTSTGRLVSDICEVARPVARGAAAACSIPSAAGGAVLDDLQGNASYLMPKVDVQVSGTFISRPVSRCLRM